MRLQLTGARDIRHVVVAACLTLGPLAPGTVAVAATKAASAKKEATKKGATKKEATKKEATKKEATKKEATKKEAGARKGSPAKKAATRNEPVVEPVVLDQDEETSTASPAHDVATGEAGEATESNAVATPPRTKNEAPGATRRMSLETTAYTDTDAVNVLSPTLVGGLNDELEGWSVGGSYLVDVVTAASVDIVSTASPSWTEVRHVGALNGSKKWDSLTVGAVAVVSREPDYLAITGGGSFSIDLMEKNVTPYFALSFEKDTIGRTDLPHEFWKDKQVTNLQAGVTLVLGRATIGSVQWDSSFERGYLAKPYRYVPLFGPGQGASVPVGASIDDVNRRRLSLRAIENLPGSRDRHALSFHLAHRLGHASLRLDERLYADDWKLLAATTEMRYILDVGQRLQLWPHLRHHLQGSVSFWKRAYEALPGPDGLVAPTLRTGDRELGPLQTFILGVGARIVLTGDAAKHWDLVFEADVGRTTFSDTLYITERRMGYATLALEAVF